MTFVPLPTVVLLMLSLGCSGATQFGGKKDKGGEKEEASGDGADDGSEVDEPQQVAGAFLCDFDDTRAATAATTSIGCGLYDPDDTTKKLIDDSLTYDLELHDGNDVKVPMKTEVANGTSKFMVLAQLPNDHKATSRLTFVARQVRGPSSGAGDSNQDDVDSDSSDEPFFSTSMSTANIGRGVSAEAALPLKSLTFDAYWDPGTPTAWLAGINTGEFCDSYTATIRKSLSPASQILIDATNSEIPTEIHFADDQFRLGEGDCLENFSLPFKSGKKYGRVVRGVGNCIFVRVINRLYISTPKNTAAELDANLQAFSNAKSCK